MDLLKGHQPKATQGFLNTFLQHKLLPTITRPMRITNNTATLIDNIFISEILQKSFDSIILVDDTLVHLPSLLMVKQTKILDKTPLEFESRLLNESKKAAINECLLGVDWNKMLDAKNSNDNFQHNVSTNQQNPEHRSPSDKNQDLCQKKKHKTLNDQRH